MHQLRFPALSLASPPGHLRRLRHLRHLARRFVGALLADSRPVLDDAVVESVLNPGELALWRRMSRADRAHASDVAARVVDQVGPVEAAALLPAALLHDVGKIESGLETWARAGATVVAGALGRERASVGDGRVARYLRHPAIGSALLELARSDPLTVAWAAEHHRPPERWSVDRYAGETLKAADDD